MRKEMTDSSPSVPQGGPPVQWPERPLTLQSLADLNKYGSVTKILRMLIANGEIADYDDELANRVRDAIEIVEGVTTLAQREPAP